MIRTVSKIPFLKYTSLHNFLWRKKDIWKGKPLLWENAMKEL